jgi:UDP-2-acetamido-2,6-beta-L-arabino-hexul-4-ose reductase
MEKTIKILITGAAGFIGKNLVSSLKQRDYNQLMLVNKDTPEATINEYLKQAQFIFHLAGVNRPDNPEQFMEGNFTLTSRILTGLKHFGNRASIVFSSSTQATLTNPYGRSKKAAEDVLIQYGKENNLAVTVYRFPNVFGKWSRPFYNSVIATFCHQVANQQPLTIHDANAPLHVVYIDDVIQELITALEGQPNLEQGYGVVQPSYQTTVGEVASMIERCGAVKKTRELPDLSNPLIKKLYATYVSFLPSSEWVYPLTMHNDIRGSFTEIIRSLGGGQVSVNVSKPGIDKGHHWHHTKHEKFIVVSGQAIIRFRAVDGQNVQDIKVTGKVLHVVEIPPGLVHSIENVGQDDLVTLMWASESFDPNHPDTFAEKVK